MDISLPAARATCVAVGRGEGAVHASSPDADVDAAATGAGPIAMIDDPDASKAVTLQPRLTSNPYGAGPNGKVAGGDIANKETPLNPAAKQSQTPVVNVIVKNQQAAGDAESEMLELGAPLPFCEESEEEEVFFGQVSEKELSKANKYSGRPTAVFNSGSFRQDPRLMRYTGLMYTIDQSLLESVTEEDDSGREDVSLTNGESHSNGLKVDSSNESARKYVQYNGVCSDQIIAEQTQAYGQLNIHLERLRLQEREQAECDADVSHLSDGSVYSPARPILPVKNEQKDISVINSLLQKTEHIDSRGDMSQNSVLDGNQVQKKEKMQDVKNNNGKEPICSQNKEQVVVDASASEHVEETSTSGIICSTPLRARKSATPSAFCTYSGVTPIKPALDSTVQHCEAALENAESSACKTLASTILKTPVVIFKESQFSPSVFNRKNSPSNSLVSTPSRDNSPELDAVPSPSPCSPFVFREPGFSPTVKSNYIPAGNGLRSGTSSPQCDIVTVPANDVNMSLSEYASSSRLICSSDEEGLYSSDEEDVFVLNTHASALAAASSMLAPPSVCVQVNPGKSKTLINSPLKMDQFSFPTRGREGSVGRETKSPDRSVFARNLSQTSSVKKSSSSSLSSTSSDNVKLNASVVNHGNTNSSKNTPHVQKITKSTPISTKVNSAPSGRKVVTAKKAPRVTTPLQQKGGRSASGPPSRTPPARSTAIKATKRPTPSSARTEILASAALVFKNGTPRYLGKDKAVTGVNSGTGPSPAKRAAPLPKFDIEQSPATANEAAGDTPDPNLKKKKVPTATLR